MISAIAPLLAALALQASVGGEIGLRAESRATTFDPSDAPSETHGGWLASGFGRGLLEGDGLLLSASYAPRFWTSDVRGRPSPLVSQDAGLRLETNHRAPWNAHLEASGTRGKTDPLADPWQALQTPRGALQATTLDPVDIEALRVGAGASIPFDRRTTFDTTAGAWQSGGVDAQARTSFPTQRGVALGMALSYLVGPRDTLQLRLDGTGTTTALVGVQLDAAGAPVAVSQGDARTGVVTLSARWRRVLTRTLVGWLGAGAAASAEVTPVAPTRRTRFAVGDVGVAYELPRGTIEAGARVDPYVDRFTGESDQIALAYVAGNLRWSPRLSLVVRASGGTRPAGATRLATVDATARYALRERLHLEVGFVGRWQRERQPELPSFTQRSGVVALAWESGRF